MLLPIECPHDIIAVLSGALAIEVSITDGDAQIAEVVGPHAGILRVDSLGAAHRPVRLRALIPTTVTRLSEVEFRRLLAADAQLALRLADALFGRAAELRERLLARSVRSARRRVAHAVLYLLDRIGVASPLAPGSRLAVSQATIAETAGIARQTANRALHELQALGLLHLESQMVRVLDRPGLETLAQGADRETSRLPRQGANSPIRRSRSRVIPGRSSP